MRETAQKRTRKVYATEASARDGSDKEEIMFNAVQCC